MSKKGHFKLMHGGFEFIKLRFNKERNTTAWVCSKKCRFGCKGKAQTRQVGDKEMVKIYDQHNHLPNDIDIE